jgi:hypothetical protein
MKRINFKINTERIEKQYWIDRLGNTHKFKGDLSKEYASFHSEIARTIYPDSNRPKDILMDLGWVMIGSVVYSIPIIHKKPTKLQIDKLIELDLYKRLHILHNSHYINFDEDYLKLV